MRRRKSTRHLCVRSFLLFLSSVSHAFMPSLWCSGSPPRFHPAGRLFPSSPQIFSSVKCRYQQDSRPSRISRLIAIRKSSISSLEKLPACFSWGRLPSSCMRKMSVPATTCFLSSSFPEKPLCTLSSRRRFLPLQHDTTRKRRRESGRCRPCREIRRRNRGEAQGGRDDRSLLCLSFPHTQSPFIHGQEVLSLSLFENSYYVKKPFGGKYNRDHLSKGQLSFFSSSSSSSSILGGSRVYGKAWQGEASFPVSFLLGDISLSSRLFVSNRDISNLATKNTDLIRIHCSSRSSSCFSYRLQSSSCISSLSFSSSPTLAAFQPYLWVAQDCREKQSKVSSRLSSSSPSPLSSTPSSSLKCHSSLSSSLSSCSPSSPSTSFCSLPSLSTSSCPPPSSSNSSCSPPSSSTSSCPGPSPATSPCSPPSPATSPCSPPSSLDCMDSHPASEECSLSSLLPPSPPLPSTQDDDSTSACLSCSSPCHSSCSPSKWKTLYSPLPAYKPKEGEEATNVGEEKGTLVTDRLRSKMEKQGYKVIGTHSAVKLCRWTKKQMQGIGGCYKHTFYGIESHRCMEATTSIVCSNRCIFCWRHHTHPASKTFRWQADPPEFILKHALEAHRSLVKPMKGAHGVTPEVFKEAWHPRHCALSLIGEALMYPHINEFLELLHEKKISSFLVMNGQHPDLLEKLDPVTQLYVSVDAPNKRNLKAVDRPLFKDYWERLLASLQILREKGERTVVRMTLIKTMNDDDLEGYASLIELGRPNFIEIKGVTFAGHTPHFSLKLSHTPHIGETLLFAEKLMKTLNEKCREKSRGALLGTENLSDDQNTPCHFTPHFSEEVDTARRRREDGGVVSQSLGRKELVPDYQLASIHEHTNSVLLADASLFYFNSPPSFSKNLEKSREVVESEQYNYKRCDTDSYCRPYSWDGPSSFSNGKESGTAKENRQQVSTDDEEDGKESFSGPMSSKTEMSSNVTSRWHTHIDFERFFELSKKDRKVENYRAVSPPWSLFNSELKGFDYTRFDVEKYLKQIAGRPHNLSSNHKSSGNQEAHGVHTPSILHDRHRLQSGTDETADSDEVNKDLDEASQKVEA